MPLAITSAEDAVGGAWARWGFYGKNGVGKTTLLRSIPLRTLVVSADQENVKPLRGVPHIQVMKLGHWTDMADVIQMFQTPLKSTLYAETIKAMRSDPRYAQVLKDAMQVPEIKSGQRPIWDVVAFDTYTRMQALAQNMIVGYTPIEPGQEALYVKRAPTLPKGYDAWQQIGALAGEWVRHFQHLPVHTIFLFQEQPYRQKDGDPSPPTYGPAMTSEALKHIRDSLEIVGRLYVTLNGVEHDGDDLLTDAPNPRRIDEHTQERRMLLVGAHESYFTKGPTHLLGYTIENPTWEKLAVSLTDTRPPEGV